MFIGAAGVIKGSMAPQLLLAWSVLRVLKYLCSLRRYWWRNPEWLRGSTKDTGAPNDGMRLRANNRAGSGIRSPLLRRSEVSGNETFKIQFEVNGWLETRKRRSPRSFSLMTQRLIIFTVPVPRFVCPFSMTFEVASWSMDRQATG